MAWVTVSSKYQIVIPEEVREKVNIQPGQKVQVSVAADGTITVDSSDPIDRAYGILPNIWSHEEIMKERREANRDRLRR